MALHITSNAFNDGQRIPARYARDGENLSPPLTWMGVPARARELAMIVEDPDAPQAEPFVHWVIYKIPPSETTLPEGVPHENKLQTPHGALQGQNSFNKIGYGGPAPPPGHGVHHYHFRLYALDSPLRVAGGLDNKSLLAAMSGHILDQAEWVGTYERP